METLVILAGIAFAVNKTVSTIKGVSSEDWNLVLTQLAVWVVGILAILLVGAANQFQSLLVPGFEEPLSNFDLSSKVALGWILGSSGSFAFDLKKAIDGTDSAVEPKLLNRP